MALVLPLFIPLIFGCAELGKYFLDQHVVVKAVRDGARYAGRQPFANMPCAGVAAATQTRIKNLIRFGNVAGTGQPRLAYWTGADTVSVNIACVDNDDSYGGVYASMTSVPLVTVSASVPYQSLFGTLGLAGAPDIAIAAQSQSAVVGL